MMKEAARVEAKRVVVAEERGWRCGGILGELWGKWIGGAIEVEGESLDRVDDVIGRTWQGRIVDLQLICSLSAACVVEENAV